MLWKMLSLFGVAVASAFIPVISIEAYVAGLYLLSPTALWLGAAVAAVGQTAGKIVWYYIGQNAARWPWLGRKMAHPKFKARTESWQAKLEGRPWLSALVLALSAVVGIPPLAIMAVVAGHLRIRVWLFIVVVGLGRFARFVGATEAVTWLGRWFGWT